MLGQRGATHSGLTLKPVGCMMLVSYFQSPVDSQCVMWQILKQLPSHDPFLVTNLDRVCLKAQVNVLSPIGWATRSLHNQASCQTYQPLGANKHKISLTPLAKRTRAADTGKRFDQTLIQWTKIRE